MKSKVILFCVLLFCSKIVDSIPHSENHIRQRLNPLSNWQVNKEVPNAQYLDTDFTQPQNVNKLSNSAIQQENNEDYYSKQREYDYDGYGYNKSPSPSPSAKEHLVNYDSPAEGRRVDSYPHRVESYPSHTSRVGSDHQQYSNQKWRSQNPFTNSVPSSVFIPNDESQLVTSVPSSTHRSHQPGRSYLTKEQLQYPSADHSGGNKHVVNPATRFGSGGIVPYDNYSESQASETKSRPTGVRRHIQNTETPSEINYETSAVESSVTLEDQSENKKVPNTQYLDTDFTQPQNVNKLTNSAIQQENNEDYYSNQREYDYDSYGYNKGPAPSPSAKELLVNYDSPPEGRRVDSYPHRVESYPSHTSRVGFDHQQYRNQKWRSQNPFTISVPSSVFIPNDGSQLVTSVPSSTHRSHQPGRSYLTREQLQYPSADHSGVNKHVVNPATSFGSGGLVPYDNYSESQASETKTRSTGVRKHIQNIESPFEINYETPAVESSATLVAQSQNIRYPVPYENYREDQASETKTRLTGVRRHVQDFESSSEINYKTPAIESSDTLVEQSENIRYPVPYEYYREDQVSNTKTRLPEVRRHVKDFETPSEIIQETHAIESTDTDQFENIRYVENSRSGSHLSNSAPITSHYDGTPVISETDNYSSDSRPSNLVPIINVKKEATVEIRKKIADKPLARKYAHRSDYGSSNIARDNFNNDAPTDITKTIDLKESKYGANFAKEKAIPIDTYPEDFLTPTNTVLENSGSHTYEESNVPQYGSSNPNNSKQNTIHHLTSEIKELSLKSLVANPEIQHILSRTDKRYVVVHSNGTIEYLDTLPLDSQQDSKLRLVHTKRKNIDGSESDGVLTPQWPQNLPSNIAETPALVDEYPWATYNQPADEYDSNPFENLPADHSHLKPLPPHKKQPAENENSKLLPHPINQSVDGGNSKPLIPNEDQTVDDKNLNQPKDDDNSKSLAPNEAQPEYDIKPKPTLENQSRDIYNSNPLPRDVNHPRDDDILKHWTSPENQPKADYSSKPLLTEANQSKDKINLTPYARNPVHVIRHEHAYVTHPANDNKFKLLFPNEAQQRGDRNSEPAHHTKPKHLNGNQPENDDNSNPSSPNKNQPADDINSEHLNKNLSGDDNVPKLLNPYYRHHEKSRHSQVNKLADGNNSNPSSTPVSLDYPENQLGDDNPAKPLSSNENQSEHNKKPKPSDTNENQTDKDNDSEPSHNRHPAHRHKSKLFYGTFLHEDDANSDSALENQQGYDIAVKPLPLNEDDKLPEDDKSDKPQILNENRPEGDIDSELLSPHKKPRAQHNTAKPKHSGKNQESDDDNPNPSSQDKNQPGGHNAAEPLTSNEDQFEVATDSTPTLPHKKPSPVNQQGDDKPTKLLSSNENQSGHNKNPNPSDTIESQTDDDNDSEPSLDPSHNRHPAYRHKSKHFYGTFLHEDDDNLNSAPENQQGDDIPAKPLPSNEDGKPLQDDKNNKPQKLNGNQSEGDIDSEPLLPQKKPRAHRNKVKPKRSHVNLESDDDNSNPPWQHENQLGDDNAAAESLLSNEDDKQLEDDKGDKPKTLKENRPEGDNDSEPWSPHKKPRVQHYNAKPKHSGKNQESDDENSNPSSQDKNQPGDHNAAEPLTSNEDQSEVATDSTPTLPHKQPRPHHKKQKKPKRHTINTHMNWLAYDDNQPEEDNNPNSPKPSHGNEPADDNNSKQPSSDENQPEDDKKSKLSKPLPGNEPADDNNIKSPSSYKNQPAGDKTLKQLADKAESSPLPHKKQRAYRYKSKSKHSSVNQLADDNASPETQPEDKISKTLPTQTIQHSRGNQPANDSTTKPLPSIENDISRDKQPENDDSSKPSLSLENRSADDHDIKPLTPKEKGPEHLNKSKNSTVNKQVNVNKSNPATPEKNQLAEDNGSKPLPSIDANQLGDETDSTSSLSHKQQRGYHKNPKQSRVNKSVDDNNFKTSPDGTQTEDDEKLPTSENQSTNGNNSKPSPPEENQPEDDIKSKPTSSVSSKNYDESKFTTLSPTVPSYTKTPKPRAIRKYKRKHRKTTANSPVVSTTPSPDDSSEHQIITLSPIEQVTDNVRDVPTLTTTTAKPVETSDKKDTYKDSDNKPDEAQDDTKSSFEDLARISDKVQTSTTTATPRTSTSRTDNAYDDKIKAKSEENEVKAVVSKENNGKDNTQTAVYNSSELLDTNTDVPEETDDYTPVIPSHSVQNDVDTGDASGDNSLELEHFETDVTITVSSGTTCDSEDEIITINIEVSESTDNANSPSNDKMLMVSIDTNPDNDDDSKALQTDVSKTTKTKDCKDDHNHDDGRSKNVEIDLSNLKGKPTMWIKTTNQDFIDKLIAKNDPQLDVIYFFSIENQPITEREKETTIFCNGTVVVETTEITYAHKDDLTPTIIKTTEIMQIEDFELYK